jgi:hypothetical protein
MHRTNHFGGLPCCLQQRTDIESDAGPVFIRLNTESHRLQDFDRPAPHFGSRGSCPFRVRARGLRRQPCVQPLRPQLARANTFGPRVGLGMRDVGRQGSCQRRVRLSIGGWFDGPVQPSRPAAPVGGGRRTPCQAGLDQRLQMLTNGVAVLGCLLGQPLHGARSFLDAQPFQHPRPGARNRPHADLLGRTGTYTLPWLVI